MSEPLDSLVRGWKQHFAAADASIEWLHSELELEVELAPGVHLVGCVDAVGRTEGEMFFGEWKTANPREKKTWKQVWRMNPQSLSYGVLAASRWPEMERFTVRKAFKEQTPTYDHVWFRYSQPELNHWRGEIIRIANEIRAYQSIVEPGFGEAAVMDGSSVPWPTNFKRCFQYGTSYACPFFECACEKQDWKAVPAGSTLGGDPTWSATSQRERIHAVDSTAIVLSPTTIVDWLDCREMYRRKYVELVTPAKGDALLLGGDFHTALGDYYKEMTENGY